MNPVVVQGAGDVGKNKQLSIDRAAFLILRVRRVFKRKLTHGKEAAAAAAAAAGSTTGKSSTAADTAHRSSR